MRPQSFHSSSQDRRIVPWDRADPQSPRRPDPSHHLRPSCRRFRRCPPSLGCHRFRSRWSTCHPCRPRLRFRLVLRLRHPRRGTHRRKPFPRERCGGCIRSSRSCRHNRRRDSSRSCKHRRSGNKCRRHRKRGRTAIADHRIAPPHRSSPQWFRIAGRTRPR